MRMKNTSNHTTHRSTASLICFFLSRSIIMQSKSNITVKWMDPLWKPEVGANRTRSNRLQEGGGGGNVCNTNPYPPYLLTQLLFLS